MSLAIRSDAASVLPDLKNFSLRWCVWVALLLCGIGIGLYCFGQQLIHGDIVTNMRTIGSGGASWGLYIVVYVFFIGVSFAGITIAALIRLFGLETLKPLARMAEMLTIICLILGACIVMADLGRPLDGLLKLPRLARPTSPFFGTFTMVIGGYLFASLVFFFLSCRADAAYCASRPSILRPFYRLWASGFTGTAAQFGRHHQTSFFLSLFILPLLVTAHSTLGFIFGIQGGRPGWFSPLQAPNFVVTAGASGIGVLIVVAAVLRRVLKLEHIIGPPVFRWLGNLVWILTVVVLYFIIAEELTSTYAAGEKERHFAHMMVSGQYKHLFLLELSSFGLGFAVLFAQFATARVSIGWSVVGGLLVNVGAVVKRYLLVVPSQTDGMMLAYPQGHYVPSLIEFGVVFGLCCLGLLLYTIFVKIFPILPLVVHEESTDKNVIEQTSERPTLRRALAVLALLVGLTLAVVGFMISNRYGANPQGDPLLPFSPVFFIAGVMLTFLSAVVYEVVPAKAP